MGKRELIALLNLSSWCLVMVERLFLVVPWGCLQFVIVVFPDHTHLLLLWTQIKLLQLTQSDLGPRCLTKWQTKQLRQTTELAIMVLLGTMSYARIPARNL